jgi:Thrombospondin type 3 repeat
MKVYVCLMALGFVTVLAPAASAANAPGECASGFCGTPNNNGGGCGCGCGGSILVSYTDIGETYSESDDYDADGYEDDFDNCPFAPNRDQADTDGDGVGNSCDNAPTVANRDQLDTDGDGMGDVSDDDADNDGIVNTSDSCAFVKNVSQLDTDGDGSGNACDDDDDGDNVKDREDVCPLRANVTQSSADCDTDADVDSIQDGVDNCPSVANSDQADTDGDKQGDLCDTDVDGDTVPNNIDNCTRVANVDQLDDDRDGAGNACDPDGYCFVASKNREAACLDPELVFSVTAAPAATAATGDNLPLALYANRENKAIRYTYTLIERPEGSRATITNPRGTVQASASFEYRFDGEKRPVFTPDVAGTYKVAVTGELVEPDSLYPSAVRAESTTTVQVTGETVNTAKGCNAGGLALAPVAAALAVLLRRFRRR